MNVKERNDMSPKRTFRRLRTPGWAALAAGLLSLGIGSLGAGPAAAQPTSNLVFSVDGGTTWSANVNAAPGQTVIAREFYDNDTSSSISGAQVTTTLPSGFSLVGGTTQVCLNPGTTDPTNPSSELECNTNTGGAAPNDQGGPIDEAAVWSGPNLTISPTAGLLTQPTNATSGILQVGEFKYLNLDQCAYVTPPGSTNPFTYAVSTTPNSPTFSAGTTASNTAQTSPVCGPGTSSSTNQGVNSGADNIPLLGQRYLNLAQCNYYFPGTAELMYVAASTPNAGWSTGSGASNSTPTSPSCGPGGTPYTQQPVNSGIANLDLLGNSYVNLDQCFYYSTIPLTYYEPTTPNSPTWSAGSNASTTPQATPTCGPGSSAFPPQALNSGVQDVNIIDTTRGQGFIQWSMKAPSPATTTVYTEDGQLTGTGTGNPTTSGTITINASVGTPLGDPLVLGGLGALVLGGGGLAVARRRRARTAA